MSAHWSTQQTTSPSMSRTDQAMSRTDQRGQQQTSLARRSGVPSVPSLLLDPFGLFDDTPFSVLRQMQREVNRVFSEVGRTGTGRGDDLGTAVWAPPIEISFQDGNLVVAAELPGLDQGDVRVEINNDVLVIQGERRDVRQEGDGGVRRSEIRYGQFYRAIALPDGADVENARAEFQNGVLRIKIPVPQSQSRQIPVQGTGAPQGAGSAQGTSSAQGTGSAQTSAQAGEQRTGTTGTSSDKAA